MLLLLTGIGLMAVGAAAFGADRPAAQLPAAVQEQRILPIPKRMLAEPLQPVRQKARAEAPVWHARRVQEPRPVRIEIPAIGISAPVIPLGLNPDRSMQVPTSVSKTGWFRGGPEPGEIGAAVIVGHVDSKRGPGVFFHLRALRRGDRIRVVLANNRKLTFAVTSSTEVSKRRFPARLVFAPTKRPTLRLITCGGSFDSSTGHYVNDHIVFAWLVGRQ
jgi:LPXTG-site transpeptidase (sortase) family protein